MECIYTETQHVQHVRKEEDSSRHVRKESPFRGKPLPFFLLSFLFFFSSFLLWSAFFLLSAFSRKEGSAHLSPSWFLILNLVVSCYSRIPALSPHPIRALLPSFPPLLLLLSFMLLSGQGATSTQTLLCPCLSSSRWAGRLASKRERESRSVFRLLTLQPSALPTAPSASSSRIERLLKSLPDCSSLSALIEIEADLHFLSSFSSSFSLSLSFSLAMIFFCPSSYATRKRVFSSSSSLSLSVEHFFGSPRTVPQEAHTLLCSPALLSFSPPSLPPSFPPSLCSFLLSFSFLYVVPRETQSGESYALPKFFSL